MTSDSPVPATAGRPSLLILGASVRAAAQSALRAGFDPTCADRYADSDLRACARVLPVADFPAGLWHALRNTASVPWIYTGSLENHPALLQRIARDHPLLGTPAEVVRAVRDPVRLNRALVAAGLPALSVRLGVEPVPPADSTWMLKPRRGAAGRGVAVWNAQARGHLTLAEPHYFQRRATGTEHSALFLAGPLSTELLGTSRQLVGLDWAGAPSAAWCGNLVPDVLTGTTLEMVAAIGRAVAAAFPLRGLFGCDFIMADGVPWLTEVNPRYTGSTELLEFHRQTSLLSQHLRACRVMAGQADQATTTTIEPAHAPPAVVPGFLGKLVLYAVRDGVFPGVEALGVTAQTGALHGLGASSAVSRGFEMPAIADIPDPGQLLRAGDPICTVYARGDDMDQCLARLRERAEQLYRWL